MRWASISITAVAVHLPVVGLKPTTPVTLAGILQDPAAGKGTLCDNCERTVLSSRVARLLLLGDRSAHGHSMGEELLLS